MTDEPLQQTEQGHVIPVPKRKDVLADLRKVAQADKPASDAGGGSSDQE